MTKVLFDPPRWIPSEEVGEYSAYRDRKREPLFPLEEEGEYGPVPTVAHPGKWTGPPRYEKREKKPKVYASYAVSGDCAMHGHKLGKYEREAKKFKPHPTRTERAMSAPPTLPSQAKLAAVVPKRMARQTSLPPPQTKQDFDMEMVRRLNLSRQISADKEIALLDRSQEEETAPDKETRAIGELSLSEARPKKGKEGGDGQGPPREIIKTEETFMESTGLLLREDSITTYVV